MKRCGSDDGDCCCCCCLYNREGDPINPLRWDLGLGDIDWGGFELNQATPSVATQVSDNELPLMK